MNVTTFSASIGLVLLIGLVTKNSILLVEYANQQPRQPVRHLSRLQCIEAGVSSACARFS